MSVEVMGYVKQVLTQPFEKPVAFVLALDNKNIKCVCNFFFPIDEGDVIYGNAIEKRDGMFEFETKPFVQVPISEDAIKICFIKALRGSGFGGVSADSLYKKLEQCSIKLGYTQEFSKKEILKIIHPDKLKINNFSEEEFSILTECTRIIIEETKTSKEILDFLKSKINQHSWDILVKKLNIQEDSNSVSVISYLSNVSYKYYLTKNQIIIDGLVAETCLKHKQIENLLIWWHKSRALRRLYLFGLNNKEIQSCKKTIDEIYNICVDNPFILPAVPIEKAHDILRSMGKSAEHDDVTCGKIVRFIYERLNNNAWPCTPFWLLRKSFVNFDSYKEKLEKEYEIYFENNYAYLDYPHIVEEYVLDYINKLIIDNAKEYNRLRTKELESPDIETNTYLCDTLTDEQKHVINSCIEHKISIINAGAGCGKSICLREIVHNLEIRKIPWHATSFTGKACSRINQIFRKKGQAITMDRTIACGCNNFRYLLIDEASMPTIELFYRFIKKFKHPCRIIFFGDVNQLPPIGWGALMVELIHSGRIPVYNLTENFRILNSTSVCLKNANKLIDPERLKMIKMGHPVLPVVFEPGDGFDIINNDNVENVREIVNALFENDIDLKDIGIISPWNEPLPELNIMVQKIYLERCINKYKLWNVGDRIMYLKNNYDVGIMNGDEGVILKIVKPGDDSEKIDGGVWVKFEYIDESLFFTFKITEVNKNIKSNVVKKGGEMGYALLPEQEESETEMNISHIIHSYALTADKYQGSEKNYIIIYLGRKLDYNNGYQSNFLNINRMYSMMTRGKLYTWLIGKLEIINEATCKIQSERYDQLGYKLSKKREEIEDGIKHLCFSEEAANVYSDDFGCYDDDYDMFDDY